MNLITAKHLRRPRDGARHGVTLVELLIALSIFAVISTAVCTLIVGACNTSRYLNKAETTRANMDTSLLRMISNLRAATALTDPTNPSPSSSFTIETQADVNNGLETYNVTYALVGTQLIETDDRYGANVLLDDVTSFSVRLQNSNGPAVLRITVVAGRDRSETRDFKVYCRNVTL